MIKNLEEYKSLPASVSPYNFKFDYEEEIPDEMPLAQGQRTLFIPGRYDITLSAKQMHIKEFYNDLGMYAFVSWRWVNPFVEWLGNRKCLEVMAGRGWLSYALRQKGVDVIATDDYSWAKEKGWPDPLTQVIKMDAIKSVEKFGRGIDVLIMAWPYMDDTAYRTIKKLHEVNPHALVVYIGERDGGCTADQSFFDHFLFAEDRQFYKTVTANYQSFNLIRDRILLGKYVEEAVYEQIIDY